MAVTLHDYQTYHSGGTQASRNFYVDDVTISPASVSNGNFETGSGTSFTGWSPTAASTPIISTAEYHGGSQSVKIPVDASNTNVGIKTSSSAVLSVTSGNEYVLEMWVKSDSVGQLQIQLRDGSTSTTGNYLQVDRVTWNSTTYYFAIPTDTTWKKFRLSFTASTSGYVYIADLKRGGLGGYRASHDPPALDATGSSPYVIAVGAPRASSWITSFTIAGSTPTTISQNISGDNTAGVDARGAISSSYSCAAVIGTSGYNLMDMIVASFNGVNQTTPTTGTPVTANSYSATATASYTGTSGNTLVVCVATQSGRTFTASNCTELAQVTHQDSSLGSLFVGTVTATGSAQTIGATFTTGDNHRLVIFELSAATSSITVTPGAANLALTTFAPTVVATNNKSVTPGAATLTLSAFTPIVSVSDNKSVTPGIATLTLTPFAPTATVTNNKFATPGTATLALTTFAPTVSVSDHKTVVPGAATLTLTAYAPTAVVSDHKTVVPGAGSLMLTAYPPTVSVSGSPAVTGSFFYSL